MEGALGAEDEGRDAVLERLGRVLVLARLHEPHVVLLGLLEVEARLVEQRRRLEHRALGAHDLGRRVDLGEEGLDRAELRFDDEYHDDYDDDDYDEPTSTPMTVNQQLAQQQENCTEYMQKLQQILEKLQQQADPG